MKPAGEVVPRKSGVTPVPALDLKKVRSDFPILNQLVNGKPLVYLDNAATSHKPQIVIDTVSRFYMRDNSNVHRGLHELSERSTKAYEGARVKVQRFLNAAESREIIFVRGTTEGINLIAHSFGRTAIGAGDEIVISTMEHHSNIVPWQILCGERGAVLRVVPINDRGEFLLDEYEKILGPKTKLVSVVHASNALGTINPVKRIIELAHAHGARVLLDGAQAVAHLPIDVRALDCDFYVFSGHKMYGPSGIGVLYGKAGIMKDLPPYQSGGDMISSVTFEKTIYNKLPYLFEAGTPNIVGAIGLGAAIGYLTGIGSEAAAAHERELLRYTTEALSEIPKVRLIGTAAEKVSVVSFVIDGIHPHDIGTILDHEGIAVRAGHHCTQPLMQRFGVPATARASFSFYNTTQEIDALVKGIHKVIEVFS